MRPSPLRAILAEHPPPDGPASAEQRANWLKVRDAVADICGMPPEQAATRVAALRASADPLDARVLELVVLRDAARGFLEAPAAPLPEAAPSPPDETYPSGYQIGPYRIVSVIGEGGMGRVYRAEDTRLLRPVALKVVTAHHIRGASPLREAQMAARLHHANIATIHDVLEIDGRLHIVMEYLEGRPLSRVLAGEALTVHDILTIFGRILAAVGHAHQAGVIHCDLKPANIIVVGGDVLKVLDFGLARLERPATDVSSSMAVAGTPQYLAPERLWGAHPNAQTDIYSLGVILSDMLRRIPAPVAAPAATTALATEEEGVRAALARIAAHATAHDPAARYPTVVEMIADVGRAQSRSFDTPSPAGLSRWWLGASVGLIVAMALLVAALGLRGRGPVAQQVLTVRLSSAGTDAVSSYVAAAITQVLEHAMSGTRGITLARPDSSRAGALTSDPAELGATHVLGGRVGRTGQDLRVELSVATREGAVLATERVSASLDALPQLSAALVDGVVAVLTRARLPVDRQSLEDAASRQVLSIKPTAFEEYAQAREYLRTLDVRDSLDHAIGLLRRAISGDPAFALAHAGLAEAYWRKYQATGENSWTDQARAAALDALRLTPDDPIVRYTLALIYRGMGRREDALVEVSKAIALQPANDDLYRLRGRLHADLGRVDRGMADLQRALELRPTYSENHHEAGVILYGAGRFEEAIPYFQREAELRPSHASAFQALGTAHQAANHQAEAIAAYEKAIALSPSANAYSNIGMLHHEGGRYADARRAYEESIRLRPRSPITHRNLGDTLRKLGDQAGARAAYERAITLTHDQLKVNPSDLDAQSLQALCLAKLGRDADTRRLAIQVLTASQLPASTRYRVGVALVLVGDRTGVEQVVAALEAGYSIAVAAKDDDLSSVRSDPRLSAALGAGAAR